MAFPGIDGANGQEDPMANILEFRPSAEDAGGRQPRRNRASAEIVIFPGSATPGEHGAAPASAGQPAAKRATAPKSSRDVLELVD